LTGVRDKCYDSPPLRAALAEVIANSMQQQMLDHQEIEWQFEAPDLEAVECCLEERPSVSGLTVVPGATKELTDTYYDTEDWRLYRAGYALRVRRDGKSVEATMKALAPAEDSGLKKRREISEPLRSGGVKTLTNARGPVGERLRLLAGPRDLRRLFEVRTRRKIFELRPEDEATEPDGSSGEVVVGPEGDIRRKEESSVSAEEVTVDALGGIHRRERGTVLAEVALDESEFSGGEGKTHLSRIEVEVADEDAGSYARVAGFVTGLRGSLELRPTETSKFETGLSATGLSPAVAPDLGPTGIDASLSAGEVAFAILRRHFAAMLAHEPGVRLGEDSEELHDMRVATRRLRAALKLYANVLPKRAEGYEKDLRWVSRVLGDVRDLDVHLERLSEDEEAMRNGEVLEEVISILEERRIEARRRMLEALNSNRYDPLVSNFSGTVRRGRSPAPTNPILETAPGLVRRRYKKVRKAADALTQDSPPEEFHDLRKKGKRLRYALEPLQGIYGKSAEKIVGLLKTLQDDLGDHQDLVVAAGLMEELGVAGDLPPRAVFSMGSTARRYDHDAAEMRADFLGSKQLRALRKGKPWKKLRKAMDKRAGG
jgi:triphosphatase